MYNFFIRNIIKYYTRPIRKLFFISRIETIRQRFEIAMRMGALTNHSRFFGVNLELLVEV